MKHSLSICLLVALATISTLQPVEAQSLSTAYFSDSYLYRHHLNPALTSDVSYFSLPALGNVSAKFGTNEGVSTFVLPSDGRLVTFMHPSVTPADFLSGLSDKVKMQQHLDLTLFSLGVKSRSGYHTFDICLHEQAGLSLPADLFSFMKEMAPDRDYHFSDVRLLGRAWADVSYGYAFLVEQRLQLGIKAKVLVGLGLADANIESATAHFGRDVWDMQLKGQLLVGGAKGTAFSIDENGRFDGIDEYKIGVAGYGGAFDLGAVYDMDDIVRGLKLSASLSDLGFIRWQHCASAANEGEAFSFSGFDHFTLHNDDQHIDGSHTGSLSDQWSDIRDDLEAMYNLRVGTTQSEDQWLAATLRFGAEYQLPASTGLSFGLLLTHRFSDLFSYDEARLNLNFGPSSVFDMAVSAAYGTNGPAIGAMANLRLPGFNLFLGSDHIYIGKVNKHFIPLEDGGLNLQLGINFPL